MRQFLDLLLNNPLILILVAGWLLSSLGSLGAKAARKAAEQQKRQLRKREERVDEAALPSAAPTTASPSAQAAPQAPAPQRNVPDADEIAAEIRKLMGIEREEPPKPARAEVQPAPRVEPAPEPRPKPAPAPPRPEPVFVDVVDTPVRAERPSAHMPSELMPSESLPSRAHGPVVRSGVPSAPRAKRAAGSLLDLSNPAAAFVAAEVLGPPRAQRGWDTP